MRVLLSVCPSPSILIGQVIGHPGVVFTSVAVVITRDFAPQWVGTVSVGGGLGIAHRIVFRVFLPVVDVLRVVGLVVWVSAKVANVFWSFIALFSFCEGESSNKKKLTF